MKIRKFAMKDYAEVRRVWEESGLEIRPGDGRDEIRLKLRRDGDLFLVAEEGGRLVGTVLGAWDGRRGWIYHIGVRPGSQRRGIGRSLLKEVEKRMKAKGVHKVNAIVYDDNAPSLGLFKSLGYARDTKAVFHGKILTREDERWAGAVGK